MRELTNKEVEEISGGVGPVGAALGGITGGVVGAMNGGGAGEIIGGIALGAVSGFFGSIAGASFGFSRYAFGGYSVGTAAIGSRIGSNPDSTTGS